MKYNKNKEIMRKTIKKNRMIIYKKRKRKKIKNNQVI